MNKQAQDYVGSVIGVTETHTTITVIKEAIPYTKYSLDETDPTVVALKALNPNVRFWLPNTMGTADLRPDRLNVHMTKGEDGLWRISSVNMG